MRCPACATDLKAEDRHGIQVAACQQCGGIWLQRGTLVRIIDRALSLIDEDLPREFTPDARYHNFLHDRGYGGSGKRSSSTFFHD
ncbi:MAG TPA: zf-TFIIB domain-containing protein [Bryobacteraceae bacterium]|nr:zf-TFIIB domain-containing protein [Bryobacteraceae bacterium]